MTTAHDAKAREIAGTVLNVRKVGIYEYEGLRNAIATALRDCEREAYERAAKLVQGYFEEYDIRSVTEELPSRIRALAQEEPK
jgi:hypothetical protein